MECSDQAGLALEKDCQSLYPTPQVPSSPAPGANTAAFAHSETGTVLHKVLPLFRSLQLLLAITLLTVLFAAQPAWAQNMNSVARSWADQIAEQSSEDLLREIEKNLPVDPSVKNAVKGLLKNMIKDRLKKTFLSSAPSSSMNKLLGKISLKLKKSRRGNKCQRAAWNTGYNAVPTNDRTVKGALEIFSDGLSNALGGGKFAKTLAQLGKSLANNIRKKLEKSLDDYLKNYAIEAFAITDNKFGCPVEVRVVWLKKPGVFHYLVLGDCKCKLVPTGKTGRFNKGCIEKFSIVGKGTAKWKGKKWERAHPNKSSAWAIGLKGRPLMKVACCNKKSETVIPSSADPWDLSVSPTNGTRKPGPAAAPKTKPETKAYDPIEDADGKPFVSQTEGTIPGVPDGPVCREKKDLLLREASDAYKVEQHIRNKLQGDYERLTGEKKDGEKVTDRQIEEARKKYEKAKIEESKAKKVYDAIQKLEVKGSCNEKHSSVVPNPEDKNDAPQVADGSDNRLPEQGLITDDQEPSGTHDIALAPSLDETEATDKPLEPTEPVEGILEHCAIAFSEDIAGLLNTTKLDMAHGKNEYPCPGLKGGWSRDLEAHCKGFEAAGGGLFTASLNWQGGLPMCRIEAQGRGVNKPLRLDATCALSFEQMTGTKIQTRLVDNGLAFRWKDKKLQCFLVTRKSVECYQSYLTNGVYPSSCPLRQEEDPNTLVSDPEPAPRG